MDSAEKLLEQQRDELKNLFTLPEAINMSSLNKQIDLNDYKKWIT